MGENGSGKDFSDPARRLTPEIVIFSRNRRRPAEDTATVKAARRKLHHKAIEPRESGGFTEIVGYRDDAEVIIDVVDNGAGISPERKQEMMRGEADHDNCKSIGIDNVDSRFLYYFGLEHGLKILSPYRQGA